MDRLAELEGLLLDLLAAQPLIGCASVATNEVLADDATAMLYKPRHYRMVAGYFPLDPLLKCKLKSPNLFLDTPNGTLDQAIGLGLTYRGMFYYCLFIPSLPNGTN